MICVISKRVIQRAIYQIELNGFHKLLIKNLTSDLFNVLYDKEKIIYPQWNNIVQAYMIANRVEIQILKLFKDAMISGIMRYSEL